MIAAAPGLTIETHPTATKHGEGHLRVSFERLNGPVSGQFVAAYTVRKDVLGNTIAGERVASGYTDATGAVLFSVPVGAYAVTSELTGYNWGTLSSAQGQGDVVVAEAQVVSLRVRLGRLTATAALVERALSGQFFIVRFQKRDVTGKLVAGERVASGYTDNSGAVSFDLTPGDYQVTSDFAGYAWGDLPEGGVGTVSVRAGGDTRVDLSGRIHVVGASGSFARIETQRTDVRGAPIADNRVASRYIDNSGVWTADLTPGAYVVTVGERRLANVVVTASRVTRVTP